MLIPNSVKCMIIAPLIIPNISNVPTQIVRGIKIKTAEINSKTPIPILPYGSNPTFAKM